MDANAVFDAFSKALSVVAKMERIQKKQAQILSVTSKKCGNCALWKKSTCIPEKQLGYKKTMKSPGCSDFALCFSSKDLKEKFEKELEDIIH